MTDAKSLFKNTFGYTPTYFVQAPGRVELLGNHTDYNEGLVLSLAVDRYVHIAASPRSDGKIELVSSAFAEREKFSITDVAKRPEASWADYVKGVLLQLRQHGVYFSGFNAAIHSTIPMGAGLSSSAALQVATALTVRQLHPYTLTPTGSTIPPLRNAKGSLPPLTHSERLHLARLCHAAESLFVGVHCGLLDPLSSLCGKGFHVMEIDCQSASVELVPLIGEVAIVLCDTGVPHALADGRYNELRAFCESAAKKLGVKSLRSVEPRMLAANKSRLTGREHACAYHIAGEIQRVIFGARALRTDDFEQFGQYLFQSHESSRDFFLNSCPELDLLVELARAHPACLGARLTGGGFGGATVNLVQRPRLDNFKAAIAKGYEERTGRKLQPMLCQVVDGAK